MPDTNRTVAALRTGPAGTITDRTLSVTDADHAGRFEGVDANPQSSTSATAVEATTKRDEPWTHSLDLNMKSAGPLSCQTFKCCSTVECWNHQALHHSSSSMPEMRSCLPLVKEFLREGTWVSWFRRGAMVSLVGLKPRGLS